jgi:predicted nucleic acid-binding protein
MTEVFADAFYYIALLNPADHFHGAAVKATKELRSSLVTTSWVLTEVADALSAPAVRQRTTDFIKKVKADSHTTVISEHLPSFDLGLELFGSRPDKSWSLTDCISFVVMQQRATTEALTGDRHFAQAGFRPLLSLADSGP